jgi:UDP:flavonoid glycosyltransferase YjiC (YdhE family)
MASTPRITIWPDIYKEQGHWLPCITLAKSLKDAGLQTVDFMGIPDTQSIVQPYGFTFNTILSNIYPPGYSLENKLEPLDQRWKPAHLMPIVRGALDSVFRPASNPPTGIIGGYFTSLETLMIARKYNIPFVIITTFLRHPENLPSLHAKTKLLYMPKAVSQALIDGINGPGNLGMSIDDFVAPLDAPNRPEIIPCPKDFDFQPPDDPDWVHRPTTSYVEPMIVRTPLPPASPPPDPTAIPSGLRLIYATSGSQVQDYEFRARIFFKNMISMMQTAGMDTYYLVLAVGSKLLTALNLEYGVGTQKPTLPTNVALFDWVSQLDIVKIADVVFMHGGLATIKESIWEQVPIVIVPLGKDQMDNALRIKRTGVGVATDVADLSPDDLRKLFTQATGSTWIRQNLASMKTIFQTAETAKPSIKIIQSAIPFP